MNYRTQLDDLVLGYWDGISEVQKEFDYSKKSLSDVIKSAKSTIDFYKSLYNLGKDLYKNNIGWDELSKILGDTATDGLIGDILYIKDNYEILKCGVEATDEEVYEFGRRTPHAIVELATIGYTVSKVANLTKAFIKGMYNTGAKLGTSFGKAGILVENPSIKVNWDAFAEHGLERMAQRGVTQDMVNSWVANGKALQQGANKYLFVTKEGAAVVTSEGKLVTTYSSKFFDESMANIVKQLYGN